MLTLNTGKKSAGTYNNNNNNQNQNNMKKIYFLLLCTGFLYTSSSQTLYQVTATNFAFTPNIITTAMVGDTIRFLYGSGFPHTTTSSGVPSGAVSWDDSLTLTKPVFNYVIRIPGTYSYICKPHVGRGMVGQFMVASAAPVKLVNFSASEVNGKAQLSWQTASEENSDHFSIEQSYNGVDFTEVGIASAAGNSNALVKYSCTVSNIVANTPYVYFRLLTIDKDKKQQYSNIVLLHFGKVADQNLMKSMYPNPAANGDHLHFDFNSERNDKLIVTVFETSGRQLYTMPLTAVEGVNQTHMPLPKLRKGDYFIQFVLGSKKQTMPLFIK